MEGAYKRRKTKIAAAVNLTESSSQDRRLLSEPGEVHGLDHAVLYKQEDFVVAVCELTDGEGADFAIGGSVARPSPAHSKRSGVSARSQAWVRSMDTSPPPQIDIHDLTNRFLIRPSILDSSAYARTAAAWFAVLERGLNAETGRDYTFAEAASAQADMEAGLTTGAVRLVV